MRDTLLHMFPVAGSRQGPTTVFRMSSSSAEHVKYFLPSVKSLVVVASAFLSPLSNLFCSAGPYAQLTLCRSKGWVEVDQADHTGLDAYEDTRSSFHHNHISFFYAASRQRFISSVNILLSRISAKITRMSLRITAQSASFFLRGW